MDEPDSLIWVKIYILELWMKSNLSGFALPQVIRAEEFNSTQLIKLVSCFFLPLKFFFSSLLNELLHHLSPSLGLTRNGRRLTKKTEEL